MRSNAALCEPLHGAASGAMTALAALAVRAAPWLLAALHAAAWAQAPAPMSAAERLVFVDPQLRNIEPPATLRYSFTRSGSLEPTFADDVSIELRPRAGGGCCAADGHFLSGQRELALPTIDDAQANPVILFFLEHDVRDMQRRTGGQQAHFRRRIRLALAEAAKLDDTTVRYGGRDVPAKEVRISPYLDDPNRARFSRYAGKEYVFVLAAGVPGGVAQLRTRVPGDGAAPLIEETLTLAER
jgi:hypothetical protein